MNERGGVGGSDECAGTEGSTEDSDPGGMEGSTEDSDPGGEDRPAGGEHRDRSERRDRVERTVRSYYEAIDADEYDRLAELLDPAFVHDRPDRTIDGRDRFVAFMRDERPMTDTEHVVDRMYTNRSGSVVRGRLLDADGEELFAYADVFTLDVEGGTVERLETYVAEPD